MPKENNKQNIDIARVEERLTSLEERFDRFCDNEFKHLQDKFDEMSTKLFWGFIVGIASILIVQVLLKFF
jgi:predicted nuclease with TOPRIM domain